MNKALSLVKNAIDSAVKTTHNNIDNGVHIHEGMNWLMRAQKMTSDGGVSEGFHMYHGWLPSYPETTGYIIETFHNYAQITKNDVYMDCAIKMVDWLCSIQFDDGSMPDSYLKRKMVFDTGQAIFGFIESYKVTGKTKYKDAAVRAADWLEKVQEQDGTWRQHAVENIPHTYYSRVAWSLLKVHEVIPEKRYVESCTKNIEWCLRQQLENGWFDNASFNLKNHHSPFTHTIAYTIRGILESGIYLQNDKYIESAGRTLENLSEAVSSNGFIGGTFDKNWRGNTRFTCLTGNAQLAICILKLAGLLKSPKYYKLGTVINGYVKSKQNISTNNLNIRGAIPGSYPIWGKYIHFTYPNWATKFFVDALLLEEKLKADFT